MPLETPAISPPRFERAHQPCAVPCNALACSHVHGALLCVVHAGFYLRQGSAVNKWKFHIQGGGWCTSLESCYQRSQTLLGSSQFFTPYVMCMGA